MTERADGLSAGDRNIIWALGAPKVTSNADGSLTVTFADALLDVGTPDERPVYGVLSRSAVADIVQRLIVAAQRKPK